MNNGVLYVVTVLIWGSTWLAINYQLGEVPAEVSLVYRYALAAAIMFGWCGWRRISLRYPVHAHLRFAAMGVMLFGLNYIASYSAQQYIPSALNAIAFSTMVWMNILNARLFFGTRIEPAVIIGAALGIAGIGALFWPEVQQFDPDDATLYGALLALGGAMVASLGNMVSQRAQQLALPVMASNAWGMLYGTGFCLAVALREDQPFVFDTSPEYVVSLLYLALFGSVIAFGCYLTLLGRIGAHRAGYAVVLFPVVAVALSWLFEGLELAPHLVIGTGLVLAGNLAIVDRSRWWPLGRRAAPVEPERA